MRGLIVAIAILAVAFGKVVDLTPDNFDSIVDGSKGAFVEFYAPWCGHCKNLAPEYEIVGEAFNRIDDVVIAKVDADAHKELGSRFDVHGFPTLKWFPKGSTTPQPYEGGRSADDIVKFVNDKAGTRARVVKPKSHINVLTDDTFDSVVLDPTKDVLVEFYAPWCGHCKSLAPTYEKLSAVYANEKNVVIANIDADAQKVKAGKYGVTGFPTLKFFPKGDKENPLSYDGGRDLPSFVSYINEKAGTHRTAEGRLAEQAGRISALDAIAARFLGADSDMVALIKEAEEAVIALTNEAEKELASYYVKVMNTIKSKGKAFLESEPTRLEKMLAGAGVTPAKVDEFTLRKNILNAFKSS